MEKSKKVFIIGIVAGFLFGVGGLIMTKVYKLTDEEIKQCRLLAEAKDVKYSYTWCWKVIKHDF